MLRPDAAIDCAPRRTDLPQEAIRAVECHPDDPLVASVGVYEFKKENDAAWTYMNRLADYGVDVSAGDCERDVPGDAAWTPGDGVGRVHRSGRLQLGELGPEPRSERLLPERERHRERPGHLRRATSASSAPERTCPDLYAWTRKYPAGAARDTPEPPGICVSGA